MLVSCLSLESLGLNLALQKPGGQQPLAAGRAGSHQDTLALEPISLGAVLRVSWAVRTAPRLSTSLHCGRFQLTLIFISET